MHIPREMHEELKLVQKSAHAAYNNMVYWRNTYDRYKYDEHWRMSHRDEYDKDDRYVSDTLATFRDQFIAAAEIHRGLTFAIRAFLCREFVSIE